MRAEEKVGSGMDATYRLQPGEGMRLGEYTILDLLGRGAMSTVYLGVDTTGHEVAIKIFTEGAGMSTTLLERFRREAEAAKKLRRHPNILTVYATGKEGPYHYIVMESIRRSKTLEVAVETTAMSVEEIVRNIIKIARALHYAHARRIVHRDVKPTNIMIDEFGEPHLADFGVAALTDWPSVTASGALTGTPLYMAPEQAATEKPTPASDIYSLGVVLYEALTGVLPYEPQHVSSVKDVLRAVIHEKPRRPRLYRKEITPDLEAVILKALEKQPDDRYPDAEMMAADLERALAKRPVMARHFTPFDHIRHAIRRRRQGLSTVGLIAIAALGLNIYFRHQLNAAQYESLLHLARFRNAQLMNSTELQPPDAAHANQAWRDIRNARTAWHAGDWDTARNHLQSAVDFSEMTGDKRTAAIAKLELARILILLGRQSEAQRAYLEIVLNPNAPLTVSSLAQLDYVTAALLEGDTTGAVTLFRDRPLPPDGPIRLALLCLSGEVTADALMAFIPDVAERFQNDLYLAAGVRYYLDGEKEKSTRALRRSVETSSHTTDWPAPVAQRIYQSMQ